MKQSFYADIIIPGALKDNYTYILGPELSGQLDRGSRVIVPFGKGRRIIGIVDKIHSDKPAYNKLRKVAGVPALVPAISAVQLDFWTWISSYYMCTRGEVMDAALPSGLKLLNPAGAEGSDIQRYKPRLKPYVSLNTGYNESSLNSLLDRFEQKSPAKYKLLAYLIENISTSKPPVAGSLPKADLIKKAGVSEATLKAMADHKIIIIDYHEEERLKNTAIRTTIPLKLSPAQEETLDSVRYLFTQKNTVLLKGVTSSGKTEIYIHLIKEQLKKGRQVLYLLPEIALTSQIINRLRKYFGGQVGVYHSGLNGNEKVEVWRKMAERNLKSRYNLILGVRSSLFLPFSKLGLIIVDEEHDASYKQGDPAPRYNARDSAGVLAGLHGAKVLLGSATPSIDSVYNCNTGKYGLVELNSRYGDVKLPEIEVADTREAYRRKIMVSHFTPRLIAATEDALKRSEQVVFFRNRRGYVPVIICNECGWTPVCPDCSVNMTYHKGIDTLKCHYCGKSVKNTGKCSGCGSKDLRMKGFGTEKIEDEISMLFPDAKIERMDLDTTRRKGAVESIIRKLEKGQIDILVGTQMISKGLDFENLTLVGVLSVDNMLFLPDFRAGERCYQMIEQVSGRAGRREKQGRVILQTGDPYNSVIRQAINHDYQAMYSMQIKERKEFAYPPFTRLVKLYIRHRNREELIRVANILARTLKSNLNDAVLGPEFPLVSKVNNNYLMTILVKIDREKGDAGRTKGVLGKAIEYIYGNYKTTTLKIYADVDPA